MSRFDPKSLTLVELIVASCFLFFVFIGAGLILNFVLQEGLITPKRMMDLEEPVNYAFSHIQKSVFPAEEINLLGTVTGNSASAVEVIYDISAAPPTGVIYALTDKDSDGNARELCYWDHAHKGEYPDTTNVQVLAKSISRVTFGNAQTPSVHNQFGLLKVQITPHDYEREGKPDQLRDYTYTCKLFARRFRSASPQLPGLVYNVNLDQLYPDIQSALNDPNIQDNHEIWLNGFDFPDDFFKDDPNREDNVFEITQTITIGRFLNIRGGYKFVYKDYENWSSGDPPVPLTATLNENATRQTRNNDDDNNPIIDSDGDPTNDYFTTLSGSRIIIFSADTAGSGGLFEGLVFEGTKNVDWGSAFTPPHNTDIAIHLDNQSGTPAGSHPLIRQCKFHNQGYSIFESHGDISNWDFLNQQSLTIADCIFDTNIRGVEIYAPTVVDIFDCEFTSHESVALYLEVPYFNLSSCRFLDNTTRVSEDNVWLRYMDYYATGEDSSITDCDFINNTADNSVLNVNGGGRNSPPRKIDISGCHFTNNTAVNWSIVESVSRFCIGPCGEMTLNFSHSDFTDNSADQAIVSAGFSGPFNLSYCDFRRNGNNMVVWVASTEVQTQNISYSTFAESQNVMCVIGANGEDNAVNIRHCCFTDNDLNDTLANKGIIFTGESDVSVYDTIIIHWPWWDEFEEGTGSINASYSFFSDNTKIGTGSGNVDADNYPGYVPFVDKTPPITDFQLEFDAATEAASAGDTYPCVNARPIGADDDPVTTPCSLRPEWCAAPTFCDGVTCAWYSIGVFLCSNPGPQGNPEHWCDQYGIGCFGCEVPDNLICPEKAGRRGDMGIYGGQGACGW